MENNISKEIRWFVNTLLTEFAVGVAEEEIGVEAEELGIDELEDMYLRKSWMIFLKHYYMRL